LLIKILYVVVNDNPNLIIEKRGETDLKKAVGFGKKKLSANSFCY